MSAHGQSGTGGQNRPRSGIEPLYLGIEETGRHDPAFERLTEMLELDLGSGALQAAFDQPERDRMSEMGAPVAAGDVAEAALAPGALDGAGADGYRLVAQCQDADQLLAARLGRCRREQRAIAD